MGGGRRARTPDVSGKCPSPGRSGRIPGNRVKGAGDDEAADEDGDDEDGSDDDFESEEAEAAPGTKSVQDSAAGNAPKPACSGKGSQPSTPTSQGQESIKKNGEKAPRKLPGPGSVDDIRAKTEAGAGKGSAPERKPRASVVRGMESRCCPPGGAPAPLPGASAGVRGEGGRGRCL